MTWPLKRSLLACVALLSISTPAAGHDLTVTYTDNGIFTIAYDGALLVSNGWPALALGWMYYSNGSVADYNYVNHPIGRDWIAASKTHVLRFQWGNISTTHSQSSPLNLDVLVTISLSSNMTGPGITNAGVGINGLLGYYCENSTDFIFPEQISGAALPCSGCWPPYCGDAVACSPSYPQAIPVDWGSGAAAWVRINPPPPPPPAPAPSLPFFIPLIHSKDPLVRGARYTVVAYMQGDLLAGSAFSAQYSLRFGDGSGSSRNYSAPLALVTDVLTAFGRARPQRTPPLKGGPIGKLFGSNCGASCTCASYSPTDCPNPRGWDNDILEGNAFNISNATSVSIFQASARAWVNRSIDICLNVLGPGPAACQGILFWSLEGSEYSWSTCALRLSYARHPAHLRQ